MLYRTLCALSRYDYISTPVAGLGYSYRCCFNVGTQRRAFRSYVASGFSNNQYGLRDQLFRGLRADNVGIVHQVVFSIGKVWHLYVGKYLR